MARRAHTFSPREFLSSAPAPAYFERGAAFPAGKKSSKNQFCLKRAHRITLSSIKGHWIPFFCENSNFFIFIKLIRFWAILPYEIQENLAFYGQCSLCYLMLLKIVVFHIRKTLPNKENMNLGPPFSTCANSDFFLKLFTTYNCQIHSFCFISNDPTSLFILS